MDDGDEVVGPGFDGSDGFRPVGCIGDGGEGAWGSSSPRMSSASSDGLRSASSSPWASRSCSRSVSRFMRARWANKLVWAACFLEGTLMDEEECSRRSRRVRAYSRFWSCA